MIKNIKRIFLNKYNLILVVLVILLIFVLNIPCENRVLCKFADNLYKYPLPPKTVVVEKTQFDGDNWVDGGQSGGYWDVVASLKLSTYLDRDDILAYYKNIKFIYPKSNEVGVELEIYFEDDMQKEQYEEGFYYRSKKGTIRNVDTYFNERGEVKETYIKGNQNRRLNYVIQIISDYNYFKID